jgi:hypothetical protein
LVVTIFSNSPTQASTPNTTSDVSPVTLTVSPDTKEQGVLTFSVHGITPGGGVDIHIKKPDNTEAPSGTVGIFGADNTGAFSCSWTLSYINGINMSGTYDIWAVDTVTGKQSNHVHFNIKVPITLTVSPDTKKQQGVFTFNGYGFTPGCGIDLHVKKPDNTEVPSGTFVTFGPDYTGKFEISFPLPDITGTNMSGTYDIWAIDTVTGKQSNHVQVTITK